MVSATRSKIQQLFTENPRRLCIKVYGNTQDENNDISDNTDSNSGDVKTLTTASKYGCRVSLEKHNNNNNITHMNNESGAHKICLLYTSPSPRDGLLSRMPSSA